MMKNRRKAFHGLKKFVIFISDCLFWSETRKFEVRDKKEYNLIVPGTDGFRCFAVGLKAIDLHKSLKPTPSLLQPLFKMTIVHIGMFYATIISSFPLISATDEQFYSSFVQMSPRLLEKSFSHRYRPWKIYPVSKAKSLSLEARQLQLRLKRAKDTTMR